RGIGRDGDELGPGVESRRKKGRDSYRGPQRETLLELRVLGFVMGFASLPLAIADERVDHEEIDCDENRAGDPERDVDRGVDQTPVGSERREIPTAQQMK